MHSGEMKCKICGGNYVRMHGKDGHKHVPVTVFAPPPITKFRAVKNDSAFDIVTGAPVLDHYVIWEGTMLSDGYHSRDEDDIAQRAKEYAMCRRIAVEAVRIGAVVEWWMPTDGME